MLNEKINNIAKPFLKWAGGKTQLLEKIYSHLPNELLQGNIKRYVEPFVGGGAVFFSLHGKFNFQEYVIADINPELILAYKTIREDAKNVIQILIEIQDEYLSLSENHRKDYFYETRKKYNKQRLYINYENLHDEWILRTAWIIFLNRTCFNGLFRVNSKGEFNVPFGRYKNPRICDEKNLYAVSKSLENVKIISGEFESVYQFVDESTFVYFDPPYRPISKTASFTSYSKNSFDDQSQLALAKFFQRLDKTGALLMLSNSDPKNIVPEDNFFDDAYKGYRIERVQASRMINSKAKGRGAINELLIMNY